MKTRAETGGASKEAPAEAASQQGHQPEATPSAALRRASALGPRALSPADVRSLQRSVGNRVVQRMLAGGQQGAARIVDPSPGEIHHAAAQGTASGGASLPHLDRIARSFGPGHDLSTVRAHVGGAAAEASARMGALAFATGDHVAFREAPSLRLAAHEAAHVVQQRGGLAPAGGIGAAGDRHERAADAVADRVAAGLAAHDLLPSGPGGAFAPPGAVQRQKGLKVGDPVRVQEGSEAAVDGTIDEIIDENTYMVKLASGTRRVAEQSVTARVVLLQDETPEDTVMRLLYASPEGFIPLRDGYTDVDTLASFGLKKDVFDAAWKKLNKARKVSPKSDGLHLSTAEKEKLSAAKDKGGGKPPPQAESIGTVIARNNRQKVEIFVRFNALMDELQIPVFLTGGAVANMLYGSPRRLKDLDYRTDAFKQTFKELPQVIQTINSAAQKVFKVFTPFKVDPKNSNSIDGEVEGCEVTVARILNVEELANYEIDRSAHLISGVDLILDKATAFISRHEDMKRATDLFDLLWGMSKQKMTPRDLVGLLRKRRASIYEKRVKARQAVVDDEYYAPNVVEQFAVSLGALLGRGLASVVRLLDTYVEDKTAVRAVRELLEALAKELGVATVDQGKEGKPAVIIQAGNMTGDMFGVAAALVHNPLAHVVLIADGSDRDKTNMLLAFYLDTLGKAGADRVHVLHGSDTTEDARDISSLYTTYAGRHKKPLPYAKLEPALPLSLLTPDVQLPVSSSTAQVAEMWDGATSQEKMRGAWRVDLAGGKDKSELDNQARVEAFLHGRWIPQSKRYLALWSRFSGKRGGPHAQHDTSFTGVRQMVNLAIAEGYVILIVGDQAPNAKKYEAIAKANGGRVANLVEFWRDQDWMKLFPGGRRQDQFLFFEHLHRTSALKHLGFRSGNLESYALLGHEVRYMEEEGNLQAGRMADWSSSARSGLGYDRIVIEDRVPTLTGQWVTENAADKGTESKPPWVELPLHIHKDDSIPGPLHSIRKDWDYKRFRARDRGFSAKDLEKIHTYLRHSDAETSSGMPTWLLELYRRQKDYAAKGWELGLGELDVAMRRQLYAFRAAPDSLLPPWLGKLLAAVHENPPEPEPVPESSSSKPPPPPPSGKGKGDKGKGDKDKGGDKGKGDKDKGSDKSGQSGKGSSNDAPPPPPPPNAMQALRLQASALALRARPGQMVRFRYLNGRTEHRGMVSGVNVDVIARIQSVANLAQDPPPSGLGALLTSQADDTAVVSASAWATRDAPRTTQMPHIVVRAVVLLDATTGQPVDPGPDVPDVRNSYFTLLERDLIR